jgi:hypothetical protein
VKNVDRHVAGWSEERVEQRNGPPPFMMPSSSMFSILRPCNRTFYALIRSGVFMIRKLGQPKAAVCASGPMTWKKRSPSNSRIGVIGALKPRTRPAGKKRRPTADPAARRDAFATNSLERTPQNRSAMYAVASSVPNRLA